MFSFILFVQVEQQEVYGLGRNGGGSSSSSSSRGLGRHQMGGVGGQWKPALQSIAEVGT